MTGLTAGPEIEPRNRGPVWLEHYRALLRVLVRLRPSDHQRSKFLDFRNRVLKVVRA